eukprot:g55996.t1
MNNFPLCRGNKLCGCGQLALSSAEESSDLVAMSEEWKIAVMGTGGVGKSCITVRFVQNAFVEGMDPTIEDSYQKQLEVDKRATRLDILDTAGQEDYYSMRDQYYRECQGFVFVFAVTNMSSFSEIKTLLQGVAAVKEREPYAVAVLGNKCDMEAERKADSAGKASFFEVSAKTGQNVSESFAQLVRDLRSCPWTHPCSCTGKCMCHEKCVQCARSFNQHRNVDHPFKRPGAMARLCTIL